MARRTIRPIIPARLATPERARVPAAPPPPIETFSGAASVLLESIGHLAHRAREVGTDVQLDGPLPIPPSHRRALREAIVALGADTMSHIKGPAGVRLSMRAWQADWRVFVEIAADAGRLTAHRRAREPPPSVALNDAAKGARFILRELDAWVTQSRSEDEARVLISLSLGRA